MTDPRPIPNTSQDTAVHDFGLALAAARAKKGNSLRDVARKLGFGKETLRELEEGLLCPDASTFARLARIFPALDHFGPRLVEARQRAARASAEAPKSAPPILPSSPTNAIRPRFGPNAPRPAAQIRLEKEPLRTPLADKLAAVAVAVAPPPPPAAVVVEQKPPRPSAAPPPFGEWLRRARVEAGLTQRALSIKMGVDNSTITSWETHRFPVPESRLPLLRKLFPSLENAPLPIPNDRAHYKPAPDRSVAAKVSHARPDRLPRGGARLVAKGEERSRAGAKKTVRHVTLERLPAGRPRPSFAEALGQERVAAKLNHGELAALLDADRRSVVFWEEGTYAPKQEAYDKLLDLFPRLRCASAPSDHDVVTYVDPPSPVQPAPPPAPALPTMLGPLTTTPAPVAAVLPAPPPSLPPSKAPAPMPPASSTSSFSHALQFLTKVQGLKKSKDAALFEGLLRTMRDENVPPADVLALLESL